MKTTTNKFYNLLYEDDNFKAFKENLQLETKKFEEDFNEQMSYNDNKNSLSMQITKCLTDIQKWKEDRKMTQQQFEDKIKEMLEQDLAKSEQKTNELKQENLKKEQEKMRLVKIQNKEADDAIKRIKVATETCQNKHTELDNINNDILEKEIERLNNKPAVDLEEV